MIKSGIDIVYNKRFKKLAKDSGFLERVFHPSELKNKNKLAGIFALKEAVMKALGKKLNWKNIEVQVRDGKKPVIKLSNEIKPTGLGGIDASLSHDGEYTIGLVVIEQRG